MRYGELMQKTKTGIARTTAGTKKMHRTFLGQGLAVMLVALGLVISFLTMRWSGSTSAIERETNLPSKKSTKR